MHKNIAIELCPFPIIVESQDLIPGSVFEVPSTCKGCKTKDCIKGYSKEENFSGECSKGMFYYVFEICKIKLVIAGIRNFDRWKVNKGDRQKFYKEDVAYWLDRKLNIENEIQDSIRSEVKATLNILHDVKSIGSLINRNVEKLIYSYQGENFDEKFEKSPEAVRNLHAVSGFLTDIFSFLDIFSNPESASFGRRAPCSIFQLTEKLKKTVVPISGKGDVRVWIEGKSKIQSNVYDSIKILLFILIDNAVKYSAEGLTVQIKIEDTNKCVYWSIENTGPTVLDDEVSRLFEKGYRGSLAKKFVREGAGIGLHIAAAIADIHGFKITYSQTPSYGINGVDCSRHRFAFLVK